MEGIYVDNTSFPFTKRTVAYVVALSTFHSLYILYSTRTYSSLPSCRPVVYTYNHTLDNKPTIYGTTIGFSPLYCTAGTALSTLVRHHRVYTKTRSAHLVAIIYTYVMYIIVTCVTFTCTICYQIPPPSSLL